MHTQTESLGRQHLFDPMHHHSKHSNDLGLINIHCDIRRLFINRYDNATSNNQIQIYLIILKFWRYCIKRIFGKLAAVGANAIDYVGEGEPTIDFSDSIPRDLQNEPD